jgi:hypothetical protein
MSRVNKQRKDARAAEYKWNNAAPSSANQHTAHTYLFVTSMSSTLGNSYIRSYFLRVDTVRKRGPLLVALGPIASRHSVILSARGRQVMRWQSILGIGSCTHECHAKAAWYSIYRPLPATASRAIGNSNSIARPVYLLHTNSLAAHRASLVEARAT